jgi:TonB-dependent starch-binding outer membrane protein SusC
MKPNAKAITALWTGLPKIVMIGKLIAILIFFIAIQANAKNAKPLKNVAMIVKYLAQKISGKVVDEKGEALPGVTVKIKGTNKGISTDANGLFSLEVNLGDVLVFSSTGFSQQEVTFNGQSSINVTLKTDQKSLEEVVVVGYGSVKRSDLTGSVSSVSAEKVTQVKGVSTIAGALQGQAAGVQVIQRSGQPGEGVSIKVRGTNSIAGGNDVLYVVDGLPLNGLSAQLNPEDIESLEILKDASSTAIYGSRGANGVIMITTKKGKSGKLSVKYNGYFGVQSLRKKIDVIDAQQFAQLQNEVAANDGQPQVWTAAQIQGLGSGTDWQDLVYQNANVQDHNLSLSGATPDTKYYTSVGYFNQEGIIPNSGFNRYSFRGNMDHKINERLSANVSLSLQQSNYKQNNYFNADGNGGVPFTTMVMPPTQGIYDANGKYTVFTGVPWGQSNPWAISHEEIRNNPQLRIIGNAQLSYLITDGLKLKSSAGIDNIWNRADYYAPTTLSLYPNGGAYRNYDNSSSFITENILNYNKSFGQHSIDVVGGFTYQTNTFESLSSGTATGFLTNVYENNNINAASVKAIPGTNFNDNRLISYLGRVNYTFAQKYLLTITGRYDGSSRFSEDHKYGFFPSAAIGWKVSEESFMKNIKAISNLKLRASYGLSGNQAIGSYQTLPQLSNQNVILNNTQTTGYYSGRLDNNSLKWETTKQLDLGFDLGLFNERIQIVADYYSKKTTDLLLNVTLPSSSGYSSVLQNVGAVGNKGFEFTVNTKNLTGKLTWNSTVTFTANRNKVLDLGKDARGNAITYKEVGSGGNWFPMVLGQPMQQLFGYQVQGVYQTDAEAVANGEPTKKAGDYRFDTSQGGVLPNDSRRILTNMQPKFTYGINNSFGYQNFNLSFMIVGSVGNDIVNEFRKYNITLNGRWAPTQEAFNNRWVAGSGRNEFDKPSANSGGTIRDYANSLWVENGSYLRLRDITFSYNFGAPVLRALNISAFQLFLSAQNFITITKYSGYDPEASNSAASVNGWDRGVYPSTKTITGGVKVSF